MSALFSSDKMLIATTRLNLGWKPNAAGLRAHRTPLNFKINSQRGQGLLEVLVAVAIGTVLIVALVSLSIKSNSTSNSSRVANQASKLSEQGMEIVVNMRNTNAANVITSSKLCNAPTCSFTEMYAKIIGSTPVSASLSACGANWCLGEEVGSPETLTYEGITFSREVFIFDTGAPCLTSPSPLTENQVKQIQVQVRWDESSGAKSRSTASCLTLRNS